MKETIPVIIDCDPGIDDAIALTVAFSLAELDIKAVTTVAGNVGIQKVSNNARAILGSLLVSNKIYKGATKPLMGKEGIEAPDAHGVSGLGAYESQTDLWHEIEKESALEAQKRIIENSKEKITIIALGPLTNIAILLLAYPELANNIEQISLMGGGLSTGNHTPCAEFNILADPEAASIVFESGIPIIMAGLDVTHQAKLYQSDWLQIKQIKNSASEMIGKALDFYFDPAYGHSFDSVNVHDAVSVLVLVYPDMCKGENLSVHVETAGKYSRGYTVADLRPQMKGKDPNCHVLLELNHDFFRKQIIKALHFYDRFS